MNVTNENLNTATTFDTFAVKKLEDLRAIELESTQYLVRKIEKGTGKDSVGVIIPAATAEDFIVALNNDSILQAATNWFNAMRGEVVKERIAEGATTILPHEFDTYKVAEYLTAEEAKEGRISKERIASWFDSQIAANLSRAFAEKLGTQWTNDKATAVLASYKTAFASLTKKEPSLNETVIENCRKALALREDLVNNPIRKYLEAKLNDAAPKMADMLGL